MIPNLSNYRPREHCIVCAKYLYGSQRLYCSRRHRQRAYVARTKLSGAEWVQIGNSRLLRGGTVKPSTWRKIRD